MASNEEIVKYWKQVHGSDPTSTDIANVQKFGTNIINTSFKQKTGKNPSSPAPSTSVNQQAAGLRITPAQGGSTKQKLESAISQFQNLTSQEGLALDMLQKSMTARRRERQPIEEEKQQLREGMVKRSLSDADYADLRPDDAVQAFSRDQNLDLTKGTYLDEVLQNTQQQLGDVLTGFADQFKAILGAKQTEISMLDSQAAREEAARSRGAGGVNGVETVIDGRRALINPRTGEVIKWLDQSFEEFQSGQEPGAVREAFTLPSGKPMNRTYKDTEGGQMMYNRDAGEYDKAKQYASYQQNLYENTKNAKVKVGASLYDQIAEDIDAGANVKELYYIYPRHLVDNAMASRSKSPSGSGYSSLR